MGWVNGEPIRSRAADLSSPREHEFLFNAASAWELSIKASIDKLALLKPVADSVRGGAGVKGGLGEWH